MASTGVNVLRWSALGLGVFYGIYHQSSIYTKDRVAKSKAEYNHKMELIEKAKAEFTKKNNPSSVKGGDIITDPEDPNFNLETFLQVKAGEK
ncbi:hypothetical protein M501DRAFT_996585 [Patellaria atrata CBS 101060]|uniref:ATP synthase F(0) complex subunit e, mitochondrial n=1 Tax=Patellaria atrata CBS 101060 TaxID=1346257 RepID=A0A9P4VQD0_9PEZI|nr:hypothetical protein M501DRAFT_996585 [Patellaria atrata CBS 101060]